MIGVNSYVELYMLPFGWQQYQSLWSVLTHTGIVLLPFLRVILKNIADVFCSNDISSAASLALRKTVFECFMMLVVIMIALQPAMNFNQEVVEFAPRFNLDGARVNVTNAATTFDGALNLPQNVKVPILYYAIMSISYGLTHALSSGLTQFTDIRQVHAELNASDIKDSALKAEVIDFYQQCWKPAYSKYIKEKPELRIFAHDYAKDDPDWLGSHFFLDHELYYRKLFSHKPIKNFGLSALDVDIEEEWGRPNCKDWWGARSYGLGERLSAHLPRNFLNFAGIFQHNAENPIYEKGIRRLLEITLPTGMQLMGDEHYESRHQFSRKFSSKVGMFWESLSAYPKLHIIISSLPVIQAGFMLIIIVTLPIILILCNYRLQAVVSIGAVIFAIIFWRYLWEMTSVLDNMLIRAFYPTSHLEVGGTNSLGEYVVDLVTMFMYVVFPLVLLTMMSWAGWSAGSGIAGLVTQAFSPIAGAGDKGAAFTTAGISQGKNIIGS